MPLDINTRKKYREDFWKDYKGVLDKFYGRNVKRLKDFPNRHKYTVQLEEVNKFEKLDVEMKLGSVLFFDQGLIHKSGNNISDRARYSLVGVYHDTHYKDFEPCTKLTNWTSLTPDDYFLELNENENDAY